VCAFDIVYVLLMVLFVVRLKLFFLLCRVMLVLHSV